MRLAEDMSALAIKFEEWPKAAQNACRWFRRVEEGEESFMRKWHDAERCRTAERHAKAAAALPTVGISTRRGGGGGERGDVLPERLSFLYGHHGLDVVGLPTAVRS